MITPKFVCSQTADDVLIEIHVSAIRASEVEIYVEGSLFSLHVNPYFLRLNLPGPVQDDDNSSADYDPSSGTLFVKLTKCNKGEEFADLDLLSKLLAPVASSSPPPQIEVLGDSKQDNEITKLTQKLKISETEIQEAAKHDWQLPQRIDSEDDSKLITTRPYGFLDLYTGFLKHIHLTENEVNELGSAAENTDGLERCRIREAREDAKFDEEYYLADYMDEETILELLRWNNHYRDTGWCELTDTENLVLLRLPRKEYLISGPQSRTLCLNLLSILFAYSYELRSTTNEPSPESAWTISVLIPSFTALDLSPASSLANAMRASYRRALAFPLYRSWRLCERVRLDVADILLGGVRSVLKCLLAIKMILDYHEVYYIYSRIWINDYCVWIQRHASSEILMEMSQEVRKLKLPKACIGWDLEGLEALAEEERAPDSDDESENDIEQMVPTTL